MNRTDEATSSSSCRELWSRHRSKVGALIFVALGIVAAIVAGDSSSFIALIWFLGLPFIYLLVRYMWLRLCRDPFLSPSDSFGSICWESITTCPPDLRRTVPTIIFVLLFVLTLIGALGGRAFTNETEPNWFILFTYNGFGSLLILVCAVWCIDFLWLTWLLLFGEKGAAKNWWWKRRLDAAEDREATNSSFEPTTDMAAAGIEEDDTAADSTDNTGAKSMQLDQDRRSAKIRAVLILVFFIWWTAWSLVAAYNPHTLELSVPIPRLPPQCDGYRLAVAADLHAGALSGVKDTEWMVQHLNSLNPDAVALVGDIGDERVNDVLRQKLEPLTRLEATDGVYYSFGNHENINDIEDFRKLFRTESPFKENIVTLENEHAILTRGNSNDCSIVMVGMADWSGQSSVQGYTGQVAPDFPLAVRSTPGPNGTSVQSENPVSTSLPMVMMQHQPANMKNAARDGVGLQLSGHTHGGQLWPQHIVISNFDAISGLHAFDVGSSDGPSYLFVSEGVVGWGPRLRFLCKTDIAIITLRNPDAMAAEGLVPDTDMTVATFAMYLAMVLVPLGVLACFVPTLCWAKKRFQDRKSKKTDNEESNEGERKPTSTTSKEGKGKIFDAV